MSAATDPLDDSILASVLDDLRLWSAPFGRRLLERVRLARGITALDLGCGTGFPLLELGACAAEGMGRAHGACEPQTRREEETMPCASLTTSNAVCGRNPMRPAGYGRRQAIRGVAAPRQYHGIACVAAPCG